MHSPTDVWLILGLQGVSNWYTEYKGATCLSHKLISESMKAVNYCIVSYIDEKGIGWATIEQNFIKIRHVSRLICNKTFLKTSENSFQPHKQWLQISLYLVDRVKAAFWFADLIYRITFNSIILIEIRYLVTLRKCGKLTVAIFFFLNHFFILHQIDFFHESLGPAFS